MKGEAAHGGLDLWQFGHFRSGGLQGLDAAYGESPPAVPEGWHGFEQSSE